MIGHMTPEITSTQLAQVPGAVVDQVLTGGTTWLTRSGRRVIALVPRAEHERAEHERAELHSLVTRLLHAAGVAPHTTPPGVEHLAALVDMVEQQAPATIRRS
jgi:antitoxin (DNA-binding transcriptional repressor) of toxin-antitoxin stability system